MKNMKTRLGSFGLTNHAIEQRLSRNISESRIIQVINGGRQRLGQSPNTMMIDLGDTYIIVDKQMSIVTVAYKKGSSNYNLYR